MSFSAFDGYTVSNWPGISAPNPSDLAIWRAVQSRLSDPAELARMLVAQGLSPEQIAAAMRACDAGDMADVQAYVDAHPELQPWARSPRYSTEQIRRVIDEYGIADQRHIIYGLAIGAGCVTEPQIDRALGDKTGTMAAWVMSHGLAPLPGKPPVVAQQAPLDYRTASVGLTAMLTDDEQATQQGGPGGGGGPEEPL